MENKEFLWGMIFGALLIITPLATAALVAVAIVIDMINEE